MQGLACYTMRAGLKDEPLAASLDLIAVEGDTEEGRGWSRRQVAATR